MTGRGIRGHWASRLPAAAAIALALLSMPLRAQDTASPAADPAEAPPPAIACKVNGYDVMLTNATDAALPEGTAIAWNVPFARREGELVLTRPLDPGATAVVTGANGANYLTVRTPCEAALAEPEAETGTGTETGAAPSP